MCNTEQAELGQCIFCDNGQVLFTEEFSESYFGDFDSTSSLVCSTKECPLNLMDESWYMEWSCAALVQSKWAEFGGDVDLVRECLLGVIAKQQETVRKMNADKLTLLNRLKTTFENICSVDKTPSYAYGSKLQRCQNANGEFPAVGERWLTPREIARGGIGVITLDILTAKDA